ncbi:hypothetical protein QUG64_03150 [Acinetobacter lwoffii]|jgi:hypothetical protein|uniref:Uncharacterized protein n=2 Tax=Acinetobacter lwoffii TaxID=28090 RepID=A0A4Y3IV78_ACILW|nr:MULTISPECIES: hypothetical protein [Acinetobacter]MBU3845966.1 hypothetical protein [Candidatus Acinetobacter avistercoris]QKU21732.1 hypothetical protein FOB19_10165 [Acinetobacter lwoffii]QXB40436.1 hypothetical protein I6L23_14890 [Acinetobacter lwoffii]GEA62955.1 hypothetical protein AL1T_02330 [Acinetobacter lwoffii]
MMLKPNTLHLALASAGMYFNFERRIMAAFNSNTDKAVTGLPEVKSLDELMSENTGLVCAWDLAAE